MNRSDVSLVHAVNPSRAYQYAIELIEAYDPLHLPPPPWALLNDPTQWATHLDTMMKGVLDQRAVGVPSMITVQKPGATKNSPPVTVQELDKSFQNQWAYDNSNWVEPGEALGLGIPHFMTPVRWSEIVAGNTGTPKLRSNAGMSDYPWNMLTQSWKGEMPTISQDLADMIRYEFFLRWPSVAESDYFNIATLPLGVNKQRYGQIVRAQRLIGLFHALILGFWRLSLLPVVDLLTEQSIVTRLHRHWGINVEDNIAEIMKAAKGPVPIIGAWANQVCGVRSTTTPWSASTKAIAVPTPYYASMAASGKNAARDAHDVLKRAFTLAELINFAEGVLNAAEGLNYSAAQNALLAKSPMSPLAYGIYGEDAAPVYTDGEHFSENIGSMALFAVKNLLPVNKSQDAFWNGHRAIWAHEEEVLKELTGRAVTLRFQRSRPSPHMTSFATRRFEPSCIRPISEWQGESDAIRTRGTPEGIADMLGITLKELTSRVTNNPADWQDILVPGTGSAPLDAVTQDDVFVTEWSQTPGLTTMTVASRNELREVKVGGRDIGSVGVLSHGRIMAESVQAATVLRTLDVPEATTQVQAIVDSDLSKLGIA